VDEVSLFITPSCIQSLEGSWHILESSHFLQVQERTQEGVPEIGCSMVIRTREGGQKPKT
jgi:hypothetical protein